MNLNARRFRRLALIIGGTVLLLMAADSVAQLNHSSLKSLGLGELGGLGDGFGIAANSTIAMFILGTVMGITLGIGIFSFYLHRREKLAAAEQPTELDLLLAEIAREEAEENAYFGEESYREDFREDFSEAPNDPWERPADWWMREEDK